MLLILVHTMGSTMRSDNGIHSTNAVPFLYVCNGSCMYYVCKHIEHVGSFACTMQPPPLKLMVSKTTGKSHVLITV